ncbi:MAG: peptidyl-prolyl cis-trans isomerase [Candidatus Puniceispirillum sp.]|nr:peptidyl-prolyl cis-trans isomerase [Candidatus Puniceispirillum sp.]
MKFFLLFLAGGFALWGIGDGSTGLIGGSDKAISAGDQSVSPREVAIEFDRTRRTYLPNTTTAEAMQGGLLNDVIGTMSREVLFRAENEDLGLTVTRAMQRDAIANEASFQDEFGQFSEGRFLQALAGAGFTEQEYLNRVDGVLQRQQLMTAISQGLRYDSALANVVAAHEMEKRTVKLSTFPVRPESIATPDDATIDSFFQENKPSYDAPQLRSAKIGSLSAAIIAEEITISDNEIRAAFDDRLDEFSTPETRSIRQMVFDDAATANAALDRLNNGEGFAAVAASMLEWTDADTNLGTVTEASLDGALVGPAFAAEAGAVVGPVQTAFGFHLLSIDTITAGGVTQLDDVREQIISTLRGEQAINLLYDRVNMLEDALGSGATIEEAIKKAGGRLDIATDIDRQGQTIDGMPAAGQVGELLQDGAILELIWDSELNEVSVIQEGSDDMFFVVNVSTETEPRERRLDEVRAQVISDYKRVEAVKSARAAAEAVAATADGDQDTAPVPAFRRNGIGLDHEAAGLIARAAFEQNSGDIQVIETGREAIAVRTIDIIPATDEELRDTSDLVLSVMNSALRDDLTNLLLVSLSKKHDLQLNVPAVQQILIGNAQ